MAGVQAPKDASAVSYRLASLFGSYKKACVGSDTRLGNAFWQCGAFQSGIDAPAIGRFLALAGFQPQVPSISVDTPFFTLVNDMPVDITLRLDPPSATNVKVHFLREGMIETIHSVNIVAVDGTVLSPDGTTLKTDSTGTARFQLQAGYGGQGLVWAAFETESGAALMIDGVITNPKRSD
ncbi:MAG TPA: hypothetical protein VN743_02525, partial [Blastocatellia bacterium]|nr:hypothetical protein [Blastocatellia bacterium]